MRSRSPRRSVFRKWYDAPARHVSLGRAAMEIAVQYRDDPSKVADKMRDVIGEIGGAHRKAAQQLAARTDVMPEEFRKALADLFDVNPSRDPQIIEAQVRSGLDIPQASLQDVLRVGTIGEVSMIDVPIAGNELPERFVVKTISPEQKELFRVDFETFGGGLMKTLNFAFEIAERVSQNAKLVRPLVQHVVNIGNDPQFQSQTMSEFNLSIEADDMQCGSEALKAAATFFTHSADYFRVPAVYEVSTEGDVMLMQFMPGQNLKDSTAVLDDGQKAFIIDDLLEIFLHGLLIGPLLHTDLHPGNVLWKVDRAGLTVVDWGLVVRIPDEHRGTILNLLWQLLNGGTTTRARLETVFTELGVTRKDVVEQPSSEEHYVELGKFFDLVAGARGQLDISNMLRASHNFDLPDWILLWQKATGALVNTLAYMKAADVSDLPTKIERLLTRMSRSVEQ